MANEMTCACQSCGHNHDDHAHDHSGHNHDHDHGTTPAGNIIYGLSLILAIPAVVPGLLPPLWQALLLVAATMLAGYPMFVAGFKGIFKLSLDEFTLMTVAVIAAFALGEWGEAFLVTALFRLGNLLDRKSVV